MKNSPNYVALEFNFAYLRELHSFLRDYCNRIRGAFILTVKKLLKENELPDIRWHDLRHSYATLLLKNDFNLKVISKILGHAKEIVTADNYINNQEIIADGVGELKNYISDVLPEETSACQKENKVYDHNDFKVEKVFGSYIA